MNREQRRSQRSTASSMADVLLDALVKQADRDRARIEASGPLDMSTDERLIAMHGLEEQLKYVRERMRDVDPSVRNVAEHATLVLERDYTRAIAKLGAKPLDLAHMRMIDEKIEAHRRYSERKVREAEADA